MRKRLTLLRHAKSSHGDLLLKDHDRPLNSRGEQDAPAMGRRLLDLGYRPSLILTSTATRARQTARLVARTINYPLEFIQSESTLYLADPDAIVDLIVQQDDSFSDLVVCAHNPGITDLANRLADVNIDNVPTCGIVCLEIKIQNWDELRNSRGNLVSFDYPKKV